MKKEKLHLEEPGSYVEMAVSKMNAYRSGNKKNSERSVEECFSMFCRDRNIDRSKYGVLLCCSDERLFYALKLPKPAPKQEVVAENPPAMEEPPPAAPVKEVAKAVEKEKEVRKKVVKKVFKKAAKDK